MPEWQAVPMLPPPGARSGVDPDKLAVEVQQRAGVAALSRRRSE